MSPLRHARRREMLPITITEEGQMSQTVGEEREREFDDWVQRRLAGWSTAEIREFDRWLLDESQFEFVAAVRRAWMRKSLEELDPAEPAA